MPSYDITKSNAETSIKSNIMATGWTHHACGLFLEMILSNKEKRVDNLSLLLQSLELGVLFHDASLNANIKTSKQNLIYFLTLQNPTALKSRSDAGESFTLARQWALEGKNELYKRIEAGESKFGHDVLNLKGCLSDKDPRFKFRKEFAPIKRVLRELESMRESDHEKTENHCSL